MNTELRSRWCFGLASSPAMVYSPERRRERESHGTETNPLLSSCCKNVAIIGRSSCSSATMLATYRGLPNVLIVMGVLIALYTFITNRIDHRPPHLCAWAATRRRRSSPASTPNG